MLNYQRLPLWRLTLLRRQLCESIGRSTYSRPSYGYVVPKLRQHCPGPGIFVEAGAVDGFFESNTYELERFHGWRGLLVEPVPAMFARIASTRPKAIAVNCALVADEAATPFVAIQPAHAMSQVAATAGSGTVRVPGRTLSSLLNEHALGPVDVLSLDIEGYEIEALKGLELARHAPRFLLVECLTPDARAQMDAFLEGRYAAVEQLTYRDVLYRAL